jgi:hypothetical protein
MQLLAGANNELLIERFSMIPMRIAEPEEPILISAPQLVPIAVWSNGSDSDTRTFAGCGARVDDSLYLDVFAWRLVTSARQSLVLILVR